MFKSTLGLLNRVIGDEGIEEADDMDADVDPPEDDDDDDDDETYLGDGGLLFVANIFTGLFMSSVILFRSPTRLNSSTADDVFMILNGFFLFMNDRK